MIDPRSAALGRRLLVGRSFNGELRDVPEPFGAVFRRMNELPPPSVSEARRLVWDGFLAGQPGAAAIVEALGAAPVEGPLPEAGDAEVDDGWGPPRLRSLPPAAAFPVDAFPEPLRRYCEQAAAALQAPVDFVGVAMLVVAGAAIGQSVNLRLKRSWAEAPLLYVVPVARPGRVKTPAIRKVVGPLAEIDRELRKQSEQARRAWEDAKKAHARDPESGPPPGPEPPQLRAVVRDITRESLVLVLRDNPRGVLADPDEAAAWVASFNEYKARGGDRQFWLSNWSGVPVSVDRKGGRESTYVPFPFAAVVGGLPPAMLGSLVDERGREDGFVDRILFAYPDDGAFPLQRWTSAELGEEVERDWAEVVRRLHWVPMVIDESSELGRPFFVDLAPEAIPVWSAWYEAHSAEAEAIGFPDRQAGAWSKMRAHAARFALILSRLRWACDPTAGSVLPGPVMPGDVRGAIALADYFKSHLARVLHEMTGGVGSPEARTILRWVAGERRGSFRRSELTRNFPRFRDDPDALEGALSWLVDRNVIRVRPEAERPEGRRGRRPLPTYDVHPALTAPENCENCENSPPGGDSSNFCNSPAPR